MNDTTVNRVWTDVGDEAITAAYATRGTQPDLDDVRARLAEQFGELKWQEPNGSFPLSPGMALKTIIKELRVPAVSAVAINGYLNLPDGPETATYCVHGVDGTYRNGRVLIYVLDMGTRLVVVAYDELG